jgi:hypothetical protein
MLDEETAFAIVAALKTLYNMMLERRMEDARKTGTKRKRIVKVPRPDLVKAQTVTWLLSMQMEPPITKAEAVQAVFRCPTERIPAEVDNYENRRERLALAETDLSMAINPIVEVDARLAAEAYWLIRRVRRWRAVGWTGTWPKKSAAQRMQDEYRRRDEEYRRRKFGDGGS